MAKFITKIAPLWRDSLADKAELWRGGLHGFERETFRLNAATGAPAASTHEQLFGQTAAQIERFCGSEAEKLRLRELLPAALTLDFSDQQIELVSSPQRDIASAEADIVLLLRFVARELPQSEQLWAFSQPPLFGPADLAAIRIANFGTAPGAKYREKYREQLLLRYGKAKQSWTTIHYNFSFDSRLDYPDDLYVHLSRNLWRNFWLLELLFGCSPSLPSFYTEQLRQHFARAGRKLAVPPSDGTSLHSHFAYGYRSSEQELQYLDYSHPCAYWQSIARIAQIESDFFRRLGLSKTSLIQDYRELYAPFRLKQLHAHGNECEDCLVDYLELRVLDIDPIFHAEQLSGIYLPAIYLAHLLLLHSVLLESPPLAREELLRCARREQYVVAEGRKLPQDLLLPARILLEELGELCSLLGFSAVYAQAVENAKQALEAGRLRVVEFIDRFSAPLEREILLEHSQKWTQFLRQI